MLEEKQYSTIQRFLALIDLSRYEGKPRDHILYPANHGRSVHQPTSVLERIDLARCQEQTCTAKVMGFLHSPVSRLNNPVLQYIICMPYILPNCFLSLYSRQSFKTPNIHLRTNTLVLPISSCIIFSNVTGNHHESQISAHRRPGHKSQAGAE